jgi:hypothetical protein
MRLMNWHKLTLAAANFACAGALATSAVAATATVSFQNGINGYTGTYDRKIDERPNPATGNPLTYDGSTQTQYFLDGYSAADNSQEGQALVRFDNIIGNGPGQIPVGATIIDASFQVTTSTSGNAQSAGPWGVSQLTGPFDSNTTYFGSYSCGGCALISRGPWFEDGSAQRPVAGFGSNWQGEVTSSDITKIMQSWASGAPNHGVVIQTGSPPGTTDGWGVLSTGHPLPERRPKLMVTYTTNNDIETNVFQRDLSGYTGDTMAYVRSGTNIVGTTTESDAGKDDITHDGLTGTYTVAPNTTIAAPANLATFQQYLDGPQFENPTGVANSVDDLALIKFGNVFGNGATQVPTDKPVAKAWLELTTGSAAAAMSNGQWSVHKVLKNWDTTTLYSSANFGATPGLQQAEGDIGAALDTQEGIIFGSTVRFDVTSYLEAVRGGATDNGLAILSSSTADGWQIHLNGSPDADLRPKLIVVSGTIPVVNPGLPGDFNGDGNVNAADYTTWRDHLGGTHNLNGNGDETGASGGLVDQADYSLWKANFGSSGSGGGVGSSAVPEPSSLAMFAAAVFGLIGFGRRK